MENKQISTIPMRRRAAYGITAGGMAILLIAGIFAAFSYGQFQNGTDYLKMIVAIIGMLFAVILFVCCCFNIRDNTQQGNIFAAVSALLYLTLLLSGMIDTLDGDAQMGRALFALQTITAILSSMIHLLFWRYQCASLPKNRARRYFTVWIYGLTLIYFTLLAINPFTGILFVVDADGHLRSSGQVLELIFISLFYLTYLLYILPQHCSLRKKLSLASFAVFPMLCIALTAIWYAAGIVYAVSSITYVFLLMAAYVVFFGDYIENKKRLLLQKAELAEQANKQTEMQTALMLSQIRPHFLYNALTAIRNLCKNDPMEAYTALGNFADYLRGNMDALGSGRIIPFEKELEHVRTYLMLEQMRFGDELNVEYDIQCCEFALPALTVQPIVENAVRHGATMKENGGMVTIRSIRTEEGIVITVTDNGPGFDPNAPLSDGRSHLGLENVRKCLTASGCGELQLDSTPGTGTTVTIRIWEDRDEHTAR